MVDEASRRAEAEGIKYNAAQKLQFHRIDVAGYGQPAGAPVAVSEGGSTLMTKLFTGTRNFASGFFTTILFLLFLLVSGDTFLRRLVEIMPSFSNKRQAVDISQQIESDISAYLVTITLLSAAVGLAT